MLDATSSIDHGSTGSTAALVHVPAAALVHAPPVAQHAHALTYAVGAATDPVALALAVPTTMAGLGAAGFGGAMVCLFCMMVLALCASKLSSVRRYLDARGKDRERGRRESRRRTKLREANPLRVAQYGELRNLVDQLERDEPAAANRYEVEDLLERFVTLAVTHEHHLATLRRVGASTGEDDGNFPPMTRLRPRTSVKSKQIAERRSAAAARCRAELDHLADELDATEELVKLIVLKVGCPTRVSDDDIANRLAELDDVDHGMRQIDEYCAGA